MAYDESLAKRLNALTKAKKGFSHKEMFGGVTYLLNGNIGVGVHKTGIIIRYESKKDEQITKTKSVRPFWLKKWFDLSLDFVKSLPPK